MAEPDPSADLAIAAAFWERWLADRRAGVVRTQAEYEALWPGHAPTIAREWAAMQHDGEAAPVRLAHFRIKSELGRGGEATVFLAEDERLQRQVALKVMRADFAPDALVRFRHEAEVTARLDPVGICPVYEAGLAHGQAYIAMRYVEGETLAKVLARRVALATPRTASEIAAVVDLVARIARVLDRAHAIGIVHRDVKPGNVMVGLDGAPVLLDFGLARETTREDLMAQSGILSGTPAYMAPEQIDPTRGARDARTDVHALGVLLHEAVTLERPFHAPTREALYQQILTTTPPDLRTKNRAVSRDLAIVVATALQKRPVDRYPSAAALADDLQAVLESRPIAARPPSPLRRLGLWARRERTLATALAGIVVLSLVVSGVVGYLLSELPKMRSVASARHCEELLESAFLRYEILDAKGALGLFEKVLALDPANEEASVGAVLSELVQDHAPDALARLAALDARSPAPSWSPRLRALALERAKQTEAAEALRRRLGEPESAFEWFVAGLEIMGGSEYQLGSRADLGLHHLSRAVALSGRARAIFHCERARAAGHASSEEAARECAAALLALWPNSAAALVYAAQALARFDPPQAIGHARRALELGVPGDRGLACNVAYVLGRSGDARGAAAVYRDLLARDPHDALARGNLATALLIQKLHKEALEHARLAAADAKRYDDDQAVLFDALLSSGAVAEARDLAVRATEREPRNTRAWLARAAVERELGQREAARASLDQALAIAPDDVEALEEDAVRAAADGDHDRARASVERAIRAASQFAHLRVLLARVCASQREFPDAIAAYDAAIALGDREVRTFGGMFLCQLAQNGLVGARPWLRRLATAIDASALLGRMVRRKDFTPEQWTECVDECGRWVRDEPRSVPAWRLLAAFAAQGDDPERGLQAIRAWRERAPDDAEAWHAEAELMLQRLPPEAAPSAECLVAARGAVARTGGDDLGKVLTLARALCAAGVKEEARSLVERALARTSDPGLKAAFARVMRRLRS